MRQRPVILLLLTFGLGVGFAASVRGQSPPVTQLIDLTVTDAAGAPVTNLTSSDLMLRVDGRVRPIVDLRQVKHESVAPLLPAPYSSNQTPPGRTIALAVDVTRLQPTHAPRIREGVAAMLSALGPRDRVSVIALASDGFASDFTSRHDIITAATEQLPAAARTSSNAKDIEQSVIASLALLEQLCTRLATEPGYKTLVFVAPPFSSSSSVRKAIQAVAAATANQRLHLIVVDPSEIASPAVPSIGLTSLASATGGVMVPASSTTAAPLADAARRTETRYELQFTLTDKEQDDKTHRVQVVSLREGTTAVTSPTIVISKNAGAPDALAALTDMLGQSTTWSDLPLRLAVYPVLDVDRNSLRLLVLGEPEEPAAALAWAEFALLSPSGAMVARWKAERDDVGARPLMTAALAPAGVYRLRMAASELSGRRGTVDVEFDARLTQAGTFGLGPLMFGGMAGDAFQPLLQTAADATAIMAYAEIYGDVRPTDTLTARFEVASATDGAPIASVDGSVRTTPSPDRRAALGTLDLTSLRAGDHLVRAIIMLNGTEIGRVTRTLRKAAQ